MIIEKKRKEKKQRKNALNKSTNSLDKKSELNTPVKGKYVWFIFVFLVFCTLLGDNSRENLLGATALFSDIAFCKVPIRFSVQFSSVQLRIVKVEVCRAD